MDDLTPKNHGEEVAIFRHSLIGELATRAGLLGHGERSDALCRLSEQRVRPPGSDTTRCYSVSTLERWLFTYLKGGLAALVPRARGDRGRGRDLDPALRELLCDIRREHPGVSVPLMLRTLRTDGRVGPDDPASAFMTRESRVGQPDCVDGHRRRDEPPELAAERIDPSLRDQACAWPREHSRPAGRPGPRQNMVTGERPNSGARNRGGQILDVVLNTTSPAIHGGAPNSWPVSPVPASSHGTETLQARKPAIGQVLHVGSDRRGRAPVLASPASDSAGAVAA